MRKKFAGAAAAAIIATSFAGAASASTHEVQSGDSLWKIAAKYNTSVTTVKSLNNLTSDLIFPKQVLIVSKPTNQNASENKVQTSTPAQTVAANTYKVVSGDNLSKIAARHNITLAQLKDWNGLKSDLIHPGLVLKVSAAVKNSVTEVKPNYQTAPQTGSSQAASKPVQASTYKVVSGDTLGRIAQKHGTTVANIKKWNNLTSDLILIGQTLHLEAKASSAPVVEAKPSAPILSKETATVIQVAKSTVGTKYAWGGSTPSGFDCSGFIYYVFNQSGKKISRLSTDGYYDRSYYVNTPEIGDLVFFENTYRRGISHMGIYVGDGKFIHAGSDGVEIASLSNSYWKSKFNGYKKFY